MSANLRVYEGGFSGAGLKFGIVVSRFNEMITERLLEGSVDCFVRHGVEDEDIEIAYVPGTFEMPLVAKRMAESGDYDAVVCLGAIIRGGTPHFDFVASNAANGVSRAALDSGIPVTFGVLTTDTIDQAVERAGTKMGNKGFEAAVTAIEMANLLRQFAVEAE